MEENNKNGKLPYLDNKINSFFGRPYKVIFTEKIVEVLIGSIKDDTLNKIDSKKYARDIIIDWKKIYNVRLTGLYMLHA